MLNCICLVLESLKSEGTRARTWSLNFWSFQCMQWEDSEAWSGKRAPGWPWDVSWYHVVWWNARCQNATLHGEHVMICYVRIFRQKDLLPLWMWLCWDINGWMGKALRLRLLHQLQQGQLQPDRLMIWPQARFKRDVRTVFTHEPIYIYIYIDQMDLVG